MPRASSSLTSGRACLRVTPAASRNSLTVNPSGASASSAAGELGGRRPARRRGTTGRRARPPGPGARAPAARPGRRRRAPAATSRPRRGRRGTGGRRADRRCRPRGRSRRRRRRRRTCASTSRSRSSSAPTSRPSGPAPASRAAQRVAWPRAARRPRRPTARPSVARRSPVRRSQLVDVDPAPLGDDPLDACGRAGPATPAGPGRRRGSRRRRPSRRGRSRAGCSGRPAAAGAASVVAGGARTEPVAPGANDVARRAPAPGPDARRSRRRRGRRRAARRRGSRLASTVSEASNRVGRPPARRVRPRRRPGSTAWWSTPTRLSATRWPGPIALDRLAEGLDGADPGRAGERARRRPGRRSPATRRSACR